MTACRTKRKMLFWQQSLSFKHKVQGNSFVIQMAILSVWCDYTVLFESDCFRQWPRENLEEMILTSAWQGPRSYQGDRQLGALDQQDKLKDPTLCLIYPVLRYCLQSFHSYKYICEHTPHTCNTHAAPWKATFWSEEWVCVCVCFFPRKLYFNQTFLALFCITVFLSIHQVWLKKIGVGGWFITCFPLLHLFISGWQKWLIADGKYDLKTTKMGGGGGGGGVF